MMESSKAMARPQKDQALNCPRCNSTNTKFCYYNNYSLSQPRYFCKTCRRYWTDGGSLRNVPVGGGSRKNRRSSSSSSSSATTSSSSPSPSSSKKLLPDHHHHHHHHLNITPTPPGFLSSSASQHPKIHEGQDLNLAFPPPPEDYNNNSMSEFADLTYNGESKPHLQNTNPSSSSSSHHHHHQHLSAMELLKSTGIASRGLGSFMAMPGSDSNSIYPSGFPLQEFKPSLNFSLDGFQSGYGSLQGVQESGARMLFPLEDLKQVSNTNEFDQQGRGGVPGDSTGYWNGMLGGGSW